jgi:hypothetical protein
MFSTLTPAFSVVLVRALLLLKLLGGLSMLNGLCNESQTVQGRRGQAIAMLVCKSVL